MPNGDGPWTKFQAPAETGPWAKFAPAAEPSLEIPDPVKQAQAFTRSQIKPLIPGTGTIDPSGGLEEAQKTPEYQDYMKASGRMAAGAAGGMAGGALVAPLVPGAGAAGGTGRLLPWFLKALTRSSGMGMGGGLGEFTAGATPKEALATAALGTGTGLILEGTGAGIGKARQSKFLKELTKSKVTKMEEAATAKSAKLTANYEKELAAHQENVSKADVANKQRMAEHQERLRRIEERHQQRLTEHEAAVKDADLGYQNKVAEHNERVQQIKDQYAKDLQEHQGIVGKSRGTAAEASARESAAEAKKGLAVQHQNDLAGLVKENLELTNQQIAKELGKEFETVQAAVEAKRPYFEYRPVAEAVKNGRRNLVMPESNKILDAMLGPEADTSGMDYATGRQLYSKLNEYLYAGKDLPSDVYGAVKGVRDAIGKQIQESANSVGLGGKFSKAMRDWSEYKSTWADKSSIAKGGSPIRRILDAEDPSFVVDQLKGKAGERLLEDIGKYSKYGGDKALAGRLKGFIAKIQDMPTSATEIPSAPKRPEFPKAPERGAIPKAPERGYLPKEPKPKELPKAPERPIIETFDREAAARQALIERIKQIGGIGGGVLTGELLYKLLAGGGSSSGAVPGGH